MKLFYFLAVVTLSFAVSFSSCSNGEKDKIRDEARQALPESDPNSSLSTAPTTSIPTIPATSNSEPHYKCPNNCAGGVGEAAGNCSVCGTALAHNQAYHNQTTPTATTTPVTPTTTPTTPPPTPSPAQNAAGVYHYTCGNGCAGGAAAAGKCASCGGDLAHNQAYHN